MQKKIAFHGIILVALIGIIFGGEGIVWAQTAESDVFAVVKMHNPEALIPQIGQLIDQFQPGMGGLVNPMMIGNMVFKNPNWTGMDMVGEYTAVVLNPMKYPQSPFAFVLPLTNQDEYRTALSQTLTGGEEAAGMYTFTQPNQKNLFVTFSGNSAILSENSDVAAQVKALVDGKSPTLAEVPVTEGQVTASLALSKIFVTVQPMIEMFKQQMLMQMEQGMQQGAAEGEQQSAGALKGVVEAEANLALSILSQTEKLQLGIGLDPEGLRLSNAIFAISESNLAKFMAAQTPQKSSLLGIIPADSGIIGSGSINFTPEFKNAYVIFLKTMSSVGAETDNAMVEKVAAWAEEAFDAIGGDFVFGGLSLADDSGLFTQVYSLKDTAKAKQLVEQYPEMLQSMMGMYKETGVDLNMQLTGKTEAKGGEIFNYVFGVTAETIPDPQGREVFNKLFGEELSLPIGFVGNYGVIGLGKNAQEKVESVMELLDSGAEVAAQSAPTQFGLPEENNMFMYVSVPKILSWAKNYIPDVPPIEIMEGPGFAMAGRFVESRFEGQLVLPIEELLAVKKIADQARAATQAPAN